ncbi:V-type H+-transporting ATPase subunit H [Nematocida sp. AWRm80]|nr:V-type H+-transporting ATPase subunit H [Nematocida sp. AWRm80]
MKIAKYVEELKKEENKDKIRAILLGIGVHPASELEGEGLEEVLLVLSANEDLLISLKALQILTRMYRHQNKASAEYYKIIAEAIREEPNGKKTEQILIFLQRLAMLDYQKQTFSQQLFSVDPLREEIARNEELIAGILGVCTKRVCKYQGLLLLWILTFSRPALKILERSPMFSLLSFVSQECKEKELRMSLGIIRNYLTYTSKYNYSAFQKIEELLSIASSKGNKEDPEEQEDLEYCRAKYSTLAKHISTFDAYLEELQSGELHPQPYHFSEEFWRNNIENIIEMRSEIIKSLKKYLKSEDPNNVWIASNDIYRIVEVYPASVSIIKQMNIHQILFSILTSKSSEDIRFHVMEALSVCYTRE